MWEFVQTLLCSVFVVFTFAFIPSCIGNTLPWPVTIETDTTLFITNKLFLSYGMDSNLIRDRWETFDFNSARLKTLAKGLGPAYLRLMGTDGDRMVFVQNVTQASKEVKSFPFPPTRFWMTAEDWDNLNRFALDAKWRIIYGVNGQTRQRNISKSVKSLWDPRSTDALLQYSIAQGYASNMDFEFGNEPGWWSYNKDMVYVSPSQLATEFQLFRLKLNTQYKEHFGKAKLFGPDIAEGHIDFFKEFLDNVGNTTIDGITWHQYYGGGNINNVNDYTNSTILDSYVNRTHEYMKVVKSSPLKHVPVWQGETSSTTDPNSVLDETYVAGFMLLDKLGVSAMLGIDVVIRQTFYGFWFALVDENLMPRPNYWTALLFHRLVGNKVLNLTNGYQNSDVRLYAHCTSPDSTYPAGTVVIYGMNLLPFNLVLQFPHQSEISVDAYLLSPPNNDPTSAGILLNGVPVIMKNDYSLPTLPPLTLKQGEGPSLPIRQYGFFVLKGFKAKACM